MISVSLLGILIGVKTIIILALIEPNILTANTAHNLKQNGGKIIQNLNNFTFALFV